MLISLNRLVGLPAVLGDKALGYVERAVPDPAARRLLGVVVRKSIGAARWLPTGALKLVGRQCVVALQKPVGLPGDLPKEMGPVFLTSGQPVGTVCDCVLADMRLWALEVTPGPWYRLLGQNAYADSFRVLPAKEGPAEVVVPRLLTWAQLQGTEKEEDET